MFAIDRQMLLSGSASVSRYSMNFECQVTYDTKCVLSKERPRQTGVRRSIYYVIYDLQPIRIFGYSKKAMGRTANVNIKVFSY